MTVRLSSSSHGLFKLRLLTIPVFLGIILFGWGWLNGKPPLDSQRRIKLLVNQADSEKDARKASRFLQKAVRIHPWNPDIWNKLGQKRLSMDDVKAASQAFRSGYAIHPGPNNICLPGLMSTAVSVRDWNTIVGLIRNGEMPGASLDREAVFPVSIRFWRDFGPGDALEILRAYEPMLEREQELAGWLSLEVKDYRQTIGLLQPLLDSHGGSGESYLRLGLAQNALKNAEAAQATFSLGSKRYPRHRRLREAIAPPAYTGYLHELGLTEHGMLLGNSVYLSGWDASPDTVFPGDSTMIRIAWEVTKPLEDLVVILHLDLGSPAPWRISADHAPMLGRFPTSTWPVGEIVIDSIAVSIPADAPQGTYRLFTGLWSPDDPSSRLLPRGEEAYAIARGELRIPLGTIQVKSPRASTDER